VSIEAGDTTAEVLALDSPHLDTHDRFEPGVTVSWDPIEGADEIYMVLRDGDQIAWSILADGSSVSFPRLPDDLDPEILLDGDVQWVVRAESYDVDEDGAFDPLSSYFVAETRGGTAGL
jgi:hypothetical protein